jgi:polysaccharide pyruvyl transferase CsaB
VPEIVISGYYGFGNAGDEAILASMVAAFESTYPGIGITVVSNNPGATEREHGVKSIARFDAANLVSSLAHADAFLLGGGSVLQDITSRRSLFYYLSLTGLARAMGRPVMLYANGFGPVTSPTGRMFTKMVLDRVQLATFRDQTSQQEVKSLGVSRPRMEVTADPVFLLEELTAQSELDAAREAAQRVLTESGVPSQGGPLIGVALRPWQKAHAGFAAEMRAAIERFAASGARVIMLPLHYDQDSEFCESLAVGVTPTVYTLKGKLRPRVMLELIGEMDAVLGMRLHSLVFAVSKCVPCAAICYDPKVSSFVEVSGIPVAADVRSPGATAVFDSIENVLRDRERVAGKLRERRIEQSKLARRNVELLTALLFGGPRACV